MTAEKQLKKTGTGVMRFSGRGVFTPFSIRKFQKSLFSCSSKQLENTKGHLFLQGESCSLKFSKKQKGQKVTLIVIDELSQ